MVLWFISVLDVSGFFDKRGFVTFAADSRGVSPRGWSLQSLIEGENVKRNVFF
jgi:hypothetical protein